MNPRVLVALVASIVAYGVLMAIRGDIASFWLRLLIAGLAGGVLGLVIMLAQRASR